MAISVVVAIGGTALDPAQVVADVAIRSGRARADDSLAASSATVELLVADPNGITVGIADVLAVSVNGYPRFRGPISEITRTQGADPLGAAFTLVAVGPISQLGRVQIAMPRPAETAAARMAAVFSAAGIPVVIEGGDKYAMAALGVAGDPPTAGDQLVGSIMADTGCVVADLGDGSVLAQFLDSRISADIWTPDPELTHVDLAWEQNDDLVNDALVEWQGSPAAQGTSPASVTRYGRRAVSLNTGLGTLAAAQERASGIVARLAYPAWEIGSVETWDLAVLDHAIGAVVTLAPLPASSPIAAGSWQGVLEGWTETYGPDATGQLAGTWLLAISDSAHSSETVSWANVSPSSLQWQQVVPETSWSEAVSNESLSGAGAG